MKRKRLPKRRSHKNQPTVYQIQHTLQQWMPHLNPNHYPLLAHLIFGLLTCHTLAQTTLCTWLALLTGIAPNTWRQRLKRLRQHRWDAPACFRALLQTVLHLVRPDRLWLALDATTLRQQHTVLGVSVVLHQTAIPIAWRVVPATQPHAWQSEWEALLACLKGQVPKTVPVYVLTDRGLWSPRLFRAIRRNGWHPLMRIVPNGQFRARWQRQAVPMEAFCPARGGQRAVEGFAFQYGLRCTLVVFWGGAGAGAMVLLDRCACF